jgi:hypothetical protein
MEAGAASIGLIWIEPDAGNDAGMAHKAGLPRRRLSGRGMIHITYLIVLPRLKQNNFNRLKLNFFLTG